jgi:hypothetical protein
MEVCPDVTNKLVTFSIVNKKFLKGILTGNITATVSIGHGKPTAQYMLANSLIFPHEPSR